MARIIKAREIWHLFDVFLPSNTDLRNLYFSVAKQSKDIQAKAPNKAQEDDFDLDAFFEQEISVTPSEGQTILSKNDTHHRAIEFAERSTEFWISQMRSRAQQDATGERLAANLKSIQALVEELALATQRLHLSLKIATALNPAESNAGVTWEAIVDRQVNIVRNSLGEFLSQLGMADTPLHQRPGIPSDQPVRRIFEPYRIQGEQSLPLTEQPQIIPTLVARDWLMALQKMVIDNAGYAGQDSLSPELNSKLGELVARFTRVQTNASSLSY